VASRRRNSDDPKSVDLQLFRVRAYEPDQRRLKFTPITPQHAIVAALNERPTAETREDHFWHVGNIVQVDPFGMSFALGRTTKSTLEQYDETTQDFVEEEFDTAPYTHVFLETQLEIVAIARKSRLAPRITGIAHQLERLLNASAVALDGGYAFEVTPISDPEEFIEYLRRAHAITQYSVTFGLPNPFDAERDFQRPAQNLLREADATRGRATIDGANFRNVTSLRKTPLAARRVASHRFRSLCPNHTVVVTKNTLIVFDRLMQVGGRGKHI
jgi:hypothetical protein